MKKIFTVCAVLIMIFCFSLPVSATSLFLSDWGVTANNLTPTTAPANTAYVQEAYTGSDPNGKLTPGWGGYTFDAKSAYIGFDGTKTYLAIVTGLPQAGTKDVWRYNNPSYNSYDWNQSLEKYWYAPGSLSLDIGGDGNYEFAVTTRADSTGSTYAPTPGEGMLVSGNLDFEDPKAWNKYDEYADWGGASDPWAVTGYDNLIDLGADFSYSYFGDVTVGSNSYATYAIEAIIDTSVLGLDVGDTLSMHWTMECGNDALDISSELVSAPVPEPGTLLLLGCGIVGFIGFRKRYKI